ncbi:MAG: hypothetical protein AAGJ87_10950, partial [Pseudomonadota bacterium]
HFVGAPGATDAGGLPLLGWSTEAADLRPAHFFALHMVQTLPLAGWIVDKFSVSLSRIGVIIAALLNGGLSIWLFLNALAGKPLSLF